MKRHLLRKIHLARLTFRWRNKRYRMEAIAIISSHFDLRCSSSPASSYLWRLQSNLREFSSPFFPNSTSGFWSIYSCTWNPTCSIAHPDFCIRRPTKRSTSWYLSATLERGFWCSPAFQRHCSEWLLALYDKSRLGCCWQNIWTIQNQDLQKFPCDFKIVRPTEAFSPWAITPPSRRQNLITGF